MLPRINVVFPTRANYDSANESGTETSSSDSDSDSDSGHEGGDGTLHRSYLKFTISQDSENQSFLSPSQFSKLDLYQIEALRDDDDPLALKKEMQGATRHFPCHVFWSRYLGARGYAVWGRRTVGQHEQEAVIAMVEAQRKERAEYQRNVQDSVWQQRCEQMMRERDLALSAERAMQRASARRAAEATNDNPQSAPVPTARIASIVHRIHRRTGSETLTTNEAESLINRGLVRLGKEALALGSFALVSAVAYLFQLHQQQPPAPNDSPALLGGFGILESPELAASADATMSATSAVFARRTTPRESWADMFVEKVGQYRRSEIDGAELEACFQLLKPPH